MIQNISVVITVFKQPTKMVKKAVFSAKKSGTNQIIVISDNPRRVIKDQISIKGIQIIDSTENIGKFMLIQNVARYVKNSHFHVLDPDDELIEGSITEISKKINSKHLDSMFFSKMKLYFNGKVTSSTWLEQDVKNAIDLMMPMGGNGVSFYPRSLFSEEYPILEEYVNYGEDILLLLLLSLRNNEMFYFNVIVRKYIKGKGITSLEDRKTLEKKISEWSIVKSFYTENFDKTKSRLIIYVIINYISGDMAKSYAKLGDWKSFKRILTFVNEIVTSEENEWITKQLTGIPKWSMMKKWKQKKVYKWLKK